MIWEGLGLTCLSWWTAPSWAILIVCNAPSLASIAIEGTQGKKPRDKHGSHSDGLDRACQASSGCLVFLGGNILPITTFRSFKRSIPLHRVPCLTSALRIRAAWKTQRPTTTTAWRRRPRHRSLCPHPRKRKHCTVTPLDAHAWTHPLTLPNQTVFRL